MVMPLYGFGRIYQLPFDGASQRGMIDAFIVCEALLPTSNGKVITGATA